jgi:hypothetical protein
MRPSVTMASSGSFRPSMLQARPASVLTINGLRTSSRAVPWPPWRASGHTAATLTSGTHNAISSAIQATPCVPARRSASASAT